MKPTEPLDWGIALNWKYPDAPNGAVVSMTEEEREAIVKALTAAHASPAVYNLDGTHTRNGITYDENGNDVNTPAASAIRILHGVLDKLNLIPATGNEAYDEGFDEATSLLQQEVDYLEGHRTNSPLTP